MQTALNAVKFNTQCDVDIQRETALFYWIPRAGNTDYQAKDFAIRKDYRVLIIQNCQDKTICPAT